ncbi:MAG: hypothetical protein SGCHY_003012 [Lobulomycetales sp.]
MSVALREAFKDPQNKAFVCYLTAGFPTRDATVPAMLALQAGGADIIELGVPFSDPIADGPTIQKSSFVALQNGITIKDCLSFVKTARASGLTVPVVLMGYANPFLSYGEVDLISQCQEVGICGFIIVDLPPDEAVSFRSTCAKKGLSYIPLIAPSTSEERIQNLVAVADSFIYVVSAMGVTGARSSVNTDLPNLVGRIRSKTSLPLAVGFGVSTRGHFDTVASVADGVVIGSKLIQVIEKYSATPEFSTAITEFAREICGKREIVIQKQPPVIPEPTASDTAETPITNSHFLNESFGDFGGQYAPEALVDCLDELERAFFDAKSDSGFWREFEDQYKYMGRPSPLHKAENLSGTGKGATIWLKREDLNHTGSHKINNAIGQILLAKRLGKTRIIAETGAGQHGVATATVCAKFEDVRRQALNVFRIKLLGATVVPVSSGSKTLKDAINEAMRDWVTNVSTTHYLVGSAIGPHPFPLIVREFQSVIGIETRQEFLRMTGGLPTAVVACVGGGSNAIGMFHAFVPDSDVRLIGVEAGGDGVDTERHSATLSRGRPGILHGTRTYLLQSDEGQIRETHSISAGLDYPGVGPEHAFLKDSGRAEYVTASDAEALIGLRELCQKEGILAALETSHAVFAAVKIAKSLSDSDNVVLCLSGRGDKDVVSVAEWLPRLGPSIDWDLRFE